MFAEKDVLDQGTDVGIGAVAMIHAGTTLQVPGTVGILEGDTGSTGLELNSVASMQRKRLDLVVRDDNQLLVRILLAVLLHHLDVGDLDVIGENLDLLHHHGFVGAQASIDVVGIDGTDELENSASSGADKEDVVGLSTWGANARIDCDDSEPLFQRGLDEQW